MLLGLIFFAGSFLAEDLVATGRARGNIGNRSQT